MDRVALARDGPLNRHPGQANEQMSGWNIGPILPVDCSFLANRSQAACNNGIAIDYNRDGPPLSFS